MNFDHAQLIDKFDQEDIFADIDPELNHFSQLYPELNSTYKMYIMIFLNLIPSFLKI